METKTLLITCILPVILCAPAISRTIYVDDDGPADFSIIQDAIDDANDGDTVFVREGTYYENINMKEGISLIGAGAEKTIIDGGQNGYVVSFDQASGKISGFKITNSGNSPSYLGGVFISEAEAIVKDNIIIGNHKGIIVSNSSSAFILGNQIINNATYGVAITSSSAVIENNIISGHYFNGIDAVYREHVIVTNNTICNNGAIGIICTQDPNNVISNNIIAYNEYGILLEGEYIYSFIEISYNNLWNNFISNYWYEWGIGCTTEDPNCVPQGDSGPFEPQPGTGEISIDPLFSDPNNGDYHLKSQAGRFDPNTQSWVIDSNTSPCIDAGSQLDDYTNELWPHGKRINMGAYGGTAQASMSLHDYGNIADLDNSDFVDFNDYALLTKQWNQQIPLLAEDLNRDNYIDYNDMAIFSSHYLEEGVPRTVNFKDYWPFETGNQWWHVNNISDGNLDIEIIDNFIINNFNIWYFYYDHGGMARRRYEHLYRVYTKNGLYITSDVNDLINLPEITGKMKLEYPELIPLNKITKIPTSYNYGYDVIAFQGTLKEVLELTQTLQRYHHKYTIEDFPSGNHANVLGFALDFDDGTRLIEIYGYHFGPMLDGGVFIMDGTINGEISIGITKPTEGQIFNRYDTIEIEAEVIQSSSPVVKMEFLFYKTYLIGVDTDGSDGWSIQWQMPDYVYGNLELTARATAESGMIVSSEIVNIKVQK